ncbi:MAG TPA: hypothetical protein VMN36_14245 [Verrucomicrobiales bacterium]|nr:hypothetical protein [Verrucomicrobiales bacterium]
MKTMCWKPFGLGLLATVLELGATWAAMPVEELRSWLESDRGSRGVLAGQGFAGEALTQEEASDAGALLWEDFAQRLRKERKEEFESKTIRSGDLEMRFERRVFGEAPEGGRSLFISMHGGGGAPARVNDRQWRNQIGLYEPEEGVYLAPRAPTDTWNLWHQEHIDGMFDRLILGCVLFEGVNPDRVYLMGYSAGGDGVFQLAPRMADRWAAAAMMAGHPNETKPEGLRNIGFTLHMGGDDAAYNRNAVAREWKEKLALLRQRDPGGYRHEAVIHEGLGHWMERRDAAALSWMQQFTRDPVPERVVWLQDDVTHGRFYWLAVDDEERKAGTLIQAAREGQRISVEAEGVKRLRIALDDRVLNLDEEIVVVSGNRELFRGRVERTIEGLSRTLEERGDRGLTFSAELRVELTEEGE